MIIGVTKINLSRIGAFSLSALIMLVGVTLSACVAPMRFEGSSMRPTINDGDRIFVTAEANEIARGDIIWFRYPVDPEKYYMKRVIGLPGETVSIRAGVVMINDNVLEESYVDPLYNRDASDHGPVTVPSGHFFVMGDNRDNSSDSRIWGTVDRSLIEGKYYQTYAGGSETR